MDLPQFLQEATVWLAWSALGLAVITIVSFILRWDTKFRLVGATVFTLLLAISSWSFSASYMPPFLVQGAKYTPIVYDNGYDLVVAQASDDFPDEAIQPTLEQIAGNLKSGGRNGVLVNVRVRKLDSAGDGISRPIILGEVIRDLRQNLTIAIPQVVIDPKQTEQVEQIEQVSP